MAIQTYLFQDGFEDGTSTAWDVSESDTSSQLDFPHYSVLARTPGLPAPYRGAYCARIVMAQGSTAAATVGDGSVDIADGETIWCRFNMWIHPNVLTESTSDDEVKFVEFQQAGGTAEFVFGINITASTDSAKWGCGVLSLTEQTTETITLGVWYTIEMKVNVQTAAATGEMEVYITQDGQPYSTTATLQIATVQQAAAVGQVIVGERGELSTTSGTVLMDNFSFTANGGSRIYPEKDRFSETKVSTYSGHVFTGPGTVTGIRVVDDGGGDNAVYAYDSDTAQIDSQKFSALMTSASQVIDSDNVPFDVKRGLYLLYVTGTPEVTVNIDRAPGWFSDGNIRRHGSRL